MHRTGRIVERKTATGQRVCKVCEVSYKPENSQSKTCSYECSRLMNSLYKLTKGYTVDPVIRTENDRAVMRQIYAKRKEVLK